MTRLYLIRHCQSAGNKTNSFQGQTNADISALGAAQLELLGLRFRNIRLDAIYSSPLLRARKTAEAINQYQNLTLRFMQELMEIDVGELEGKPLHDLIEEYPLLAHQWNEAPQECSFPGGESMRQVYDRAAFALHKILSENEGKTVAVTAHGCLLRNMVCALLAHTIDGLPGVELAGNTAVSEFLISEGDVQTIHMNDCSHLPAALTGNPHQYLLK